MAARTPEPAPPQRPAGRTTTLPAQPTPLVGRDREVAALAARLLRPDARLLTLTGPPGAGKTRLAIALAGDIAGAFGDGVWFVRLESVREPDQVVAATAQALGVREAASEPLLDTLIAQLAGRRLLLVLDNFEQVLAAGTQVADLLAACPDLTVLVTSRAPLRLRWEQEVPVAPLALPDPADSRSPDAVARSPAVTLFVQRARAVRPDFSLTADNAATVAAICARLDGLPLALELAAARVRLLTPRTLLERLSRRLLLLTSGAREAPTRHQTLRAALAWSYDLLTPAERSLFRCLGVLAGGASIEAVEAIADLRTEDGGRNGDATDSTVGCSSPVLDLLESLVEKSLVRREETATGEPRLRLLETVREFALEELSACGELESVRLRHAAHFLALAETAEPHLTGTDQTTWLGRLEAEQDNLSAALSWSVGEGGGDAALRLAGALWRFWIVRGQYSEGRRWLERALSTGVGASASLRAKALNGAGMIAWNQGEYERATTLLEESLSLRQEVGDERAVAGTLSNLALVAVNQGDLARACALHEEGLAIVRTLDDRRRISISLNNLALVVYQRSDVARAQSLVEEGLALARELGDTWQIATTAGNLGEFARRQGDLARAAVLLSESMTLFRALGARRRLAECFEEFAGLAAAQGRPRAAARLGGAADALRESMGAPPDPMERAAMEATIAAARASLGDDAFAAERAAGRALPLDDAIAEALSRRDEAATDADASSLISPPSSLLRGLTPREAEVLALIAGGASNREIAERLVVSVRTVEHHISAIYRKIEARGRADATAYALRHGLV